MLVFVVHDLALAFSIGRRLCGASLFSYIALPTFLTCLPPALLNCDVNVISIDAINLSGNLLGGHIYGPPSLAATTTSATIVQHSNGTTRFRVCVVAFRAGVGTEGAQNTAFGARSAHVAFLKTELEDGA